MAVAVVPRGFNDTRRIEPARNGVKLISGAGKSVTVRLCADFLRTGMV